MIKILVITTVRFRLNGITSVILNYYRNMDKSDMQIDFVVPNEISDEYKREFEVNRSKVYRLYRKKNPLKYMMELYKILKEINYDIVHVHGNSAMMLLDIFPAVMARTSVRIVHSHNTTCSHIKMHKMLLPIFKKCYTKGLACGQDAGRWLYQNDDFVELKNGIDLKTYQFDKLIREEYRKKIHAGDRIVIGHVGNFIEQKNHKFLLDWYADLIKKNDKYLLLLLSDGELLEKMKLRVNQLGIDKNVLFLGIITEVSKYMQAMDIFVLPSLHEGLPVVLVEAQAAGLPCLVSDTVAKESDITRTLEFISIDDTQKWVDAVITKSSNLDCQNREEQCIENQVKIEGAGYDVCKNAEILKKIYCTLCSKIR